MQLFMWPHRPCFRTLSIMILYDHHDNENRVLALPFSLIYLKNTFLNTSYLKNSNLPSLNYLKNTFFFIYVLNKGNKSISYIQVIKGNYMEPNNRVEKTEVVK